MTPEERIAALEKRLEKLEKQVGAFQNVTFPGQIQLRDSTFTAVNEALASLSARIKELEDKKL